jgi:hypothetical protein
VKAICAALCVVLASGCSVMLMDKAPSHVSATANPPCDDDSGHPDLDVLIGGLATAMCVTVGAIGLIHGRDDRGLAVDLAFGGTAGLYLGSAA